MDGFDRYKRQLANTYSEEVLVSSEEVFAREGSWSNTLIHGQRHAPRWALRVTAGQAGQVCPN